jgi:hypothetical protein
VKQVQIVCAVIVVLCFLGPFIEGIPHLETLGGALALGSMILEPVASAAGETAARKRKG